MPRKKILKKKPKIALCVNGIRGYELLKMILSFDYPVEFVASRDKDESGYEEKIAEFCRKKKVRCIRKTNDRKKPLFLN